MTASADAELISRLAGDDQSAVDEAYRVFAHRCKAVAMRTLSDDALAQDAVQEAFLSLWHHRSGLVVRAAGIGPWLVVVTRNAALNLARTARRRSAREAAHALPESAPDPTELAVANVEAAGLHDAIEQLPDEQRRVILLAYFGGATLAEVAARTGSPLGTVKRRAQLALARLARTLGGAAR